MVRATLCVCLCILCLSHQLLWLNYGIRIQTNQIPVAEVITCCCEPNECSCEGHESTCGTVISSCFEGSGAPLGYMVDARIKILPPEKAFFSKKSVSTNFTQKIQPHTRYGVNLYSFMTIHDIFHPPEPSFS